MASLTSVLDIAKTALLTSQKAINVTSHNISNANTPGYTRQTAVLEAMDPVNSGGLFYGTGVNVSSIERVYDNFQTVQLRGADSNLSRFESNGTVLKTLETAFNDFNGSGLSSSIDAFFNSFQDVANSPSTTAERSALLSNASILSDRFNAIDSTIRTNLTNFNSEIESQVKQINSVASQVAELNRQISTVEIAGVSANDLRDKRDTLLDSLSKMVDITTRENKTGEVDVYIGGGSFLVAGVKASPLSVDVNKDNPELYNIISNGTVMNDRINGGSLKGIIDGSRYYQQTQDRLNVLAASLVKAVNVAHRQGYGLDGSTGADFFAAPSVYTKASAFNTGGAVITGGAVTDQSLLTLNDYEVRFSDPTHYNVVNKTANSIVTSGLYTSGSPIVFDGLTFTITDNTGTPGAGDAFEVSATKNSARNIAVSLTDPKKIAASASAATLPGDNRNALALAGLKDSASASGSTFNDYYNALVSDIGFKAGEAGTNYDAQQKVTEQLQTARDSLSGVSLEEEAVNLVKLQKSYEAAAKVMATADKMLDALLNMR